MKNLKNIIRRTFVLMLLVGLPTFIIAQDPPPDPCPDNTLPDCPIDSGVVLLCGAALILGFIKTYDYKKNVKHI